MIDLLLKLKWWDRSIEEIDSLIPILTSSDLEKVRKEQRTMPRCIIHLGVEATVDVEKQMIRFAD